MPQDNVLGTPPSRVTLPVVVSGGSGPGESPVTPPRGTSTDVSLQTFGVSGIRRVLTVQSCCTRTKV